MAAKKTARKRSSAPDPSLQQQAEVLQQKLGESAQQIWLAGVGAFGRAQTEGNRLFDTLVKEGSRVEQRAGTRAGKLRDALDDKVQGARTTFGKVDQAFRTKVQGALKSLEVPTRRELAALIARIEGLNGQLRQHNDTSAPKPATRKATKRTAAPAKRAPAKKAATKKAAVKKAATSKAAPRKVVKKTARVAKRPAARAATAT
jgi:poly(hydroxyalkanoate) granule-associated protein